MTTKSGGNYIINEKRKKSKNATNTVIPTFTSIFKKQYNDIGFVSAV